MSGIRASSEQRQQSCLFFARLPKPKLAII